MNEEIINKQADTIIRVQELVSQFPIRVDVLKNIESRLEKGEHIGKLYVLDENKVVEWFINLKKTVLSI